jgi:hypothetical protein
MKGGEVQLDPFPFDLTQAVPLRHLSPVGRGRIGERSEAIRVRGLSARSETL